MKRAGFYATKSLVRQLIYSEKTNWPWHRGADLVGDATSLDVRGRHVLLDESGADPGRDDAALALTGICHSVAQEVHAGLLKGVTILILRALAAT